MKTRIPEASVLVIFGAGGDLTWRKLIPAVYNICVDEALPEHFAVIGIDRKEMSEEQFLSHLHDGVNRFSRRGEVDDEDWKQFSRFEHAYIQADFSKSEVYSDLSNRLEQLDEEWGLKSSRIFYLATPPTLVEMIVNQLGQAGLAEERARARIVVEKPFGHDLGSARELNELLTGVFEERQIYRIDHYLGKETVQNILAFRFANTLFEPIWNRRYIDHVQITVAEQVGVGHRGAYYEGAGALRDMIQNHLLQVLSLIAMEAPVSFDADEIRNKKVDVLHAIRQIPAEHVHEFAARGQYDRGWIEGEEVEEYRSEENVAADSMTETFAAIKLYIDNWRWQDVPFYLRTGKRLPKRASQVTIEFNPVPHQSFPPTSVSHWEPNRLVIRIQPEEGIDFRFLAKQPGLAFKLSPVDMRFMYSDAFRSTPPEAYEELLLDVMLGDATLFMRADQVEAAWSVVMPILSKWAEEPAADFPNYDAGTWGPPEADVLIAQEGRSWIQPRLRSHDGNQGSVQVAGKPE
ncbi:MAG: glucose-6-phosphate dehydrogenase [Anaerolineales bacterium]|jgi:glucose-6-phosphate 1-dehydrogenase